MSFNREAFRELTAQVIHAERPGFWSDWTDEQQRMYLADDWEGFSRSRGYSEEEIAQYRGWREMAGEALREGLNPFRSIADLAEQAAERNKAQDHRGEIDKSSIIHRWMKVGEA